MNETSKLIEPLIEPKDAAIAYFFLRAGTGINLLIHGWGRIGASNAAFRAWLLEIFAQSGMPQFLLQLMGVVIPGVELLVGLMLILGVRTRSALCAASGLMISLIFGMCLIQKWEIVGLQMTYLLIYFVLTLFLKTNHFSLDRILERRKSV
jgi:thiosulfate dehydrogenase [quinone] large subunit